MSQNARAGSLFIGIMAALFAAFAWSVNFAVPFVLGRYTIFDLALIRFTIAGLACALFIALRPSGAAALTGRDWLLTLWLGALGYLGYFLALVGGAIYAGPVIAPAIIGLVPVVLALAGNLMERSVPWRSLAIPITSVTLGLVLIERPRQTLEVAPSVSLGVACAIAAVALWTWFGLVNQRALQQRPRMDAGVWTALLMIGAAAGAWTLAPFGFALHLFQMPKLGLGWHAAASLYAWSAGLALLASIGGAWAWTVAAQLIPVSLAAQLVVMEAVFGASLGLIVHRRWPTLAESAGMAAVIAGVVLAIRAFEVKRPRTP
jgi:drug/metabolite transporter (DMT)-like permease